MSKQWEGAVRTINTQYLSKDAGVHPSLARLPPLTTSELPTWCAWHRRLGWMGQRNSARRPGGGGGSSGGGGTTLSSGRRSRRGRLSLSEASGGVQLAEALPETRREVGQLAESPRARPGGKDGCDEGGDA
eukprot:CAMPEP_0181184236 /NCGR_PEP_ID=MMETSP1096-20121128/8855_1 /TAXON_ID=156174 ORGANISM="Chrysochromulina ericina, Strain CCMP281" /NCGR_SAMPLE_ID=MMETSP1096 /ASSEMBLY_ACC=CAM_ASM_000453 /LENGTH=130 /DNA_ID=CAMNT_0023272977 /DNA_START=578 /DNA_END=969 /DNA_ORIENTATION=+